MRLEAAIISDMFSFIWSVRECLFFVIEKSGNFERSACGNHVFTIKPNCLKPHGATVV